MGNNLGKAGRTQFDKFEQFRHIHEFVILMIYTIER